MSGASGWSTIYAVVEEYDPVSDVWMARTPIPTPRWCLAADAVYGKIYAVGGADFENVRLTTVEEYDRASDPTGADEESETTAVPAAHELFQNYPNPFRPQTVIRYDLPEAGAVRLCVYNVLGQTVRTLVDGQRSPGTHTVTWDARDGSSRRMASGSYLYRLEVEGKHMRTRWMELTQ
jgi:hypothetical protein